MENQVKSKNPKANKKKNKKNNSPYRYEVLYRPGDYMSDKDLNNLVFELCDTAKTSFEDIPNYQVFRGTREELTDKVISIAWREDGKIGGFCSTVILHVEGVGDVIHLGLTIVRPEDRSNGLTHILTNKAVAKSLLKYKPLVGKLWISNCAAVLSSLVNVSLYFEQVYPSPLPKSKLTKNHIKIAEAIDTYYRDKIYIHDNAHFDFNQFVFRGSVQDTVFQKNKTDKNYYHRNHYLNEYYKDKMRFENGDEVLQIGFASTFAAIKHMCRNLPIPKLKNNQMTLQENR